MYADRRRAPRTAVTPLNEVTLSGPDYVARCTIKDLSPYGARFEFQDQGDASPLEFGARLMISGCPEPLKSLLFKRVCVVVWKGDWTFGAEFTTPLTPSLTSQGGQFISF